MICAEPGFDSNRCLYRCCVQLHTDWGSQRPEWVGAQCQYSSGSSWHVPPVGPVGQLPGQVLGWTHVGPCMAQVQSQYRPRHTHIHREHCQVVKVNSDIQYCRCHRYWSTNWPLIQYLSLHPVSMRTTITASVSVWTSSTLSCQQRGTALWVKTPSPTTSSSPGWGGSPSSLRSTSKSRKSSIMWWTDMRKDRRTVQRK